MKTYCYYVFTNHKEAWFDDYGRAYDWFDKWATKYGSARLYEETYDENEELEDETCMEAVGEFPW